MQVLLRWWTSWWCWRWRENVRWGGWWDRLKSVPQNLGIVEVSIESDVAMEYFQQSTFISFVSSSFGCWSFNRNFRFIFFHFDLFWLSFYLIRSACPFRFNFLLNWVLFQSSSDPFIVQIERKLVALILVIYYVCLR